MNKLYNKKSNRSVVLLWSLVIALIFSLLFLGLYPKLFLWTSITQKLSNEVYFDWGFYSAIEYAKKILLETASTPYNNFNQLWASENLSYNLASDYYFKITIKDEDGKFPLNSLFTNDFLNPISERYRKIYENIIKNSFYPSELLQLPKLWEERIKLQRFKVNLLTFEEFITFPQISYNLIFNTQLKPLTDFVTVYSTGKININTVSKEVFLSLADNIDETAFNNLQIIIKNNKEAGISNISELSKYSEFQNIYETIKDLITVESLYYVVTISVFYQGDEKQKSYLFKKIRSDKKLKFEKLCELPFYKYEFIPKLENIKNE